MTDKPIIFSAPMVQALLAGRKTQTRRLIRLGKGEWIENGEIWAHFDDGPDALPKPYRPGDRLYVREAWCGHLGDPPTGMTRPFEIQTGPNGPVLGFFKADDPALPFPHSKWRPSIHQPRWASRLTLTLTEVRVQRLQEISEADAMAEGGIGESGEASCGEGYCDAYWFNHGQLHGESFDTARDSYSDLWNSLHGPDAWSANPRVVAVSFTVEQRNIDA